MRLHVFSALILAGAASMGPSGTTAWAGPQVAIGPTAADVAGRVQAFYDQVQTFQAEFTQRFVIRVHPDAPASSEGKVLFEKPGKMSWKYNAPNGTRLVADGREVKLFEPNNQQMFVQPQNLSQYGVAFSFLTGTGNLQSSFTLRMLDADAMGFASGYVLEGVPKVPAPAYEKVLFYVDKDTSQVRKVMIIDAQGNKNTIAFNKVLANMPLQPNEFTLTPPAGTRIIRP